MEDNLTTKNAKGTKINPATTAVPANQVLLVAVRKNRMADRGRQFDLRVLRVLRVLRGSHQFAGTMIFS
jgi:hypothetical protein